MEAGYEMHITVIDNGLLVATPPERPAIVNQQGQPQQRPTVHYCADFDDLTEYLKEKLVIS